MTDIASNLDKVIEKIDGMTSEVVPKNYGMDIASKVDHIAKQLDYVQAGGGSGGGDIAIVHMTGGMNIINSCDKTFDEITQLLNDEKILFAVVDAGNNLNKGYYNYVARLATAHLFTRITSNLPYGSTYANVTVEAIEIDTNNNIKMYTWMSNT